jgi:hypothetical protein
MAEHIQYDLQTLELDETPIGEGARTRLEGQVTKEVGGEIKSSHRESWRRLHPRTCGRLKAGAPKDFLPKKVYVLHFQGPIIDVVRAWWWQSWDPLQQFSAHIRGTRRCQYKRNVL